jgi:hypothetical protein
MRTPRGNFVAYLTEEHHGVPRLVPGSIRYGHNIITRTGVLWLGALVRWVYPASGNDLAASNKRLRWIGVGTGLQYEDRNITSLANGIAITPSVYMKVLSPPIYTTEFGVKFSTTFLTTDFGGGSYDISEAAIYADVDAGSGPELSVAVSTNAPVAYKSISPSLPKRGTNSLTILWEFRF